MKTYIVHHKMPGGYVAKVYECEAATSRHALETYLCAEALGRDHDQALVPRAYSHFLEYLFDQAADRAASLDGVDLTSYWAAPADGVGQPLRVNDLVAIWHGDKRRQVLADQLFSN